MQELFEQSKDEPHFIMIEPQNSYNCIALTSMPSSSNWSSPPAAQHVLQQTYASEANSYSSGSFNTTVNYFKSESILSDQMEPRSNQLTRSAQKKKKSNKSTYKHVPHREKPVHLVARRNARERRRVQAVNTAFAKLRKCVPVENRNKRLSKVKTLHRAIEYIAALQNLLNSANEQDGISASEQSDSPPTFTRPVSDSVSEKKYNKENRLVDQRWISLDTNCNHFNEPYVSNHGYYDPYTPLH